jgi:hypothetical protein
MSNPINIHLVKTVVDMAIFLEFTNPDLIDPDTAVRGMEQMAAELQLMEKGDQAKFVALLKELSNTYPDGRERSFVEALAELFGLE